MPPPFKGANRIRVIPPVLGDHVVQNQDRKLYQIPRLLLSHATSLASELGARIELGKESSIDAPNWYIGPHHANPALRATGVEPALEPEVRLYRSQRMLVTDAPTAAGIFETFGFLFSLSTLVGDQIRAVECKNILEASRRIATEVQTTFASPDLLDSDWKSICDRHENDPLLPADPIAGFERWLAELKDGHTRLRPNVDLGLLPYELLCNRRSAHFVGVPVATAGYKAGLRAGFKLNVREVSDAWHRTSASNHSRPYAAGRRLMSGIAGQEHELEAEGPSGRRIRWREAILPPNEVPAVERRRLRSGTGYLRVSRWVDANVMDQLIGESLEDLYGCTRLIVDLRGNQGGNSGAAQRFRSRFISYPKRVGYLRVMTPSGVLGPFEPIDSDPANEKDRWPHPVRFVIDPLTASASEEAILGLADEPKVKILGQRSAGAVGWIRSLPLYSGYRLFIRQALAFDNQYACLDGTGLSVHSTLPLAEAAASASITAITLADEHW